MNITIVGAGSLGLLLAGKLAAVAHGYDITLVTRTSRQADRITSSGLLLTEEERRVHVTNVKAVPMKEAATLPLKAAWVFLTTKQTHWNEGLLQMLKATVQDGANLLCFQNGVGHVDRLREAVIPLEQVYLAVTTEGARKDGDHSVSHTGKGMTSLGGARKSTPDEPLGGICNMLGEAGLQAEVVADIDWFVWRKLLINSVINPLTAVLRIQNGELLASPHYMQVMRTLFEEGTKVVQRFDEDEKEQLWEQLLTVCEMTATNTSSMLQDVLAGRETEIESINGAIVRLASRQKANAPTHELMYHLVKGSEPR